MGCPLGNDVEQGVHRCWASITWRYFSSQKGRFLEGKSALLEHFLMQSKAQSDFSAAFRFFLEEPAGLISWLSCSNQHFSHKSETLTNSQVLFGFMHCWTFCKKEAENWHSMALALFCRRIGYQANTMALQKLKKNGLLSHFVVGAPFFLDEKLKQWWGSIVVGLKHPLLRSLFHGTAE